MRTLPPRPNNSKSQMMTVFLFEILCSVFSTLNNPHFSGSRVDRRYRYIESVFASHPSAMPTEEKDVLQERLADAVRALNELVLGRYDVEHIDHCGLGLDEGTASQLAYVCCGGLAEHKKSSTEYEHQKSDVDSLAVGCLDIGGGSIDVSIVRYAEKRPADLGCKILLCDLEFIGGTRRGGDDLVELLCKELILKQISCYVGVESKVFKTLLSYGEVVGGRAGDSHILGRMTHGFLYPLGLRYLSMVESGEGRFSVGDVSGLDLDLIALLQEKLESQYPKDVRGKIIGAEIELQEEGLRSVVFASLGDDVKGLSSLLRERGAEVLVLTGRLSVLPQVLDLVLEGSDFAPSQVISLHRAPALKALVDVVPPREGWAVDPKFSVLLGLAVWRSAALGYEVDGRKIQISREGLERNGYWWGVVSSRLAKISSSNALFSAPAEGEEYRHSTRIGLGSRIVVGRTSSVDRRVDADPVYEIRPCSDATAEVELYRARSADAEEVLEIQELNGVEVDMRLRTMFEDEYWLDL